MADATKVKFQKTPQGNEMFAFDSVTQLQEYVDPTAFKFEGRSFTFGEANKGEDLKSWEQVEKRFKTEWAEGIYIFNQFVEKLTSATLPDVKDHKRRTRYSEVEGDDIDFDRMRNGQSFWRKSAREETTGPSVMTVVIDTTTPAFQNSDNILWRGAAAIALTKVLEEKGWSVEVWVVNGSKLYAEERTSVYTACCLKKPSDPLDVSSLINTVSGWFYRTETFTLLTTICKNRGKQVAHGFGSCTTPTEEDLDLLSPLDEFRIYSAGVFSFDGALGIIQTQLDRLKSSYPYCSNEGT